MNRPRIPYRVDPMQTTDLDRVMEIESVVHSAPWPISAYRHELEENDKAHYWVVMPTQPPAVANLSWRNRLNQWLRRANTTRPIVGYAGYWQIVDEAHISTIAVDPEWRRLGLGELLLLEMLESAISYDAVMMTLEVRVSNTPALQLYEKYGFDYEGRRKRYYRDNHEDAHIMTVTEIQSAEYRALLDERWLTLITRLTAQ